MSASPPQLVEPVSPHGPEEVGVRQNHSADGRVRPAGALSVPGSAELRPRALEDGREVDEVLAEEEGADDHRHQQRRDPRLGAEPQHVSVTR